MRRHLANPTLCHRTEEILTLNAQTFADYFYQELFKAHSGLGTSFRNTNLAQQKEKLIEGITHIFALLDDEEELKRYLYDLGLRHVCYEVTEERYSIVKDVLLQSVQHIHQSEWNQEYENWWRSLITTITEHMINGSRSLQEVS